MPIPNLTIIGESINDSVPSTHRFFEANDITGLKELAVPLVIDGTTNVRLMTSFCVVIPRV